MLEDDGLFVLLNAGFAYVIAGFVVSVWAIDPDPELVVRRLSYPVMTDPV